MLPCAPKIICNKYKYENNLPVPTCELTEEEHEAFEQFYNTVKEENESRFIIED